MDGHLQNSQREPSHQTDAAAHSCSADSATRDSTTRDGQTREAVAGQKATHLETYSIKKNTEYVQRENRATRETVTSSTTFSATVQAVAAKALETFQQEIDSQQLYYHGLEHVEGVDRRAKLIFDTVVPWYEQAPNDGTDWDRQRELLHLSAIAHDMLQIFRPQTSPHTPRQRRSGDSEKATIKKLLIFLQEIKSPPKVDAEEKEHSSAEEAHFSSTDIQILEEAIKATICQYDSDDGSIYQPWLYAEHREGKPISLVARCLALADIGTLGIDGIEAYRKEGALLLLEENTDIIPFLKNRSEFDSTFRENVRERLLKRARFEVAFARGRLNRLDQELSGLPTGAIDQLKEQVFKHLTPQTIETIAAETPTSDSTSLAQLLNYFQLERCAQQAP